MKHEFGFRWINRVYEKRLFLFVNGGVKIFEVYKSSFGFFELKKAYSEEL